MDYIFVRLNLIYLPANNLRRISALYVRGYLQGSENGRVVTIVASGRWFSLGLPVSSTNTTDLQDITEMLLKVALSTISMSPYNLRALISKFKCNSLHGMSRMS